MGVARNAECAVVSGEPLRPDMLPRNTKPRLIADLQVAIQAWQFGPTRILDWAETAFRLEVLHKGGTVFSIAFCTSHQADPNARRMGKHSPLECRGYAIRMVLLIVSEGYDRGPILGALRGRIETHKMSSGSPPHCPDFVHR